MAVKNKSHSEDAKTSPIRVIIAGWHDDSNKGDAAILLALVRLIGSHVPVSKFYIQLGGHLTEECYAKMLRHTNMLLEKPLVPLPSFFMKRTRKRILTSVVLGLLILRSVLLLLAPKLAKFLLNRYEYRAFNVYQSCNALIGKGGHYFYGGKRVRDLVRQYIQVFPFLLARRLKVPYALVGISIGPYTSFIEKVIPRLVLNGAVAISARERISLEEIRKIVNTKTPVYPTTDLALWLQFENCFRKKSLTDKLPHNYIIFCPRAFFPGDPGNQKYFRYIDFSRHLLKELVMNYGKKVIILPNAVGVEDDSDFVRRIQCDKVLSKELIYINEDLNVFEILEIYKSAELTIGTRLHSCIFSLIARVPCIAISYYGPKMAVLADYGLDKYIFNVESLDLEMFKRAINYILKHRLEIVNNITISVNRAKDMIANDGALRMICRLISKGENDGRTKQV